jgi:chromosome segregation ATPase
LLRKLVFCLWIFLTLGCCATDDPTKGGLFCYNPGAYKRRLEERRQEIAKQEITRQALTQESRTLQNEAKAQRVLRDQEREKVRTLKYELAQLEDDIVRMQKESGRYKTKAAEQIQEKQRINREIQEVRKRINLLKSSPHVSEAEKIELQRQNEELIRKLIPYLSPE